MSETDRFGRWGERTAVAARDDLNVSGLDALFRSKQIDVLVCRSGMNVAYLSGMASPGTLGRHLDLADTPRETFVVWPASGEPTLITSEIASQLARATSRIGRLEVYADYVDNPEHKLAAVLRDFGLDGTRAGFDKGWFGTSRWTELMRMLPRLDAVDCTEELDFVRAVKTEAEVESLRAAAELLDRTLEDVFPTIRAGETERQVHARITAKAVELGADSIHGILQSSRNPVLYGGESDERMDESCIVRTDYVLYLDGYAANLSRPLHVGRPSSVIQREYGSYVDICRQAVALLRPGAVGGEVHRTIQQLFVSAGLSAGPPISGHGLGRWFHQQTPLLVAGSSDVLEAGMVIALEPISGHWHLQDEFLITDSEPIRISDRFEWNTLPWTA